MHYVLGAIAAMLAVGLIPVTYCVWRHLDDLIDHHALVRGTRHQPRALRMMGSTVGVWLGYTGLLTLSLGQWVPALVLGVLWAILAVSSAFSRRHGVAPWWYNRVPV